MAFPARSKKSGGFIVTFPDVCKTPASAGPIPIPYPNIASTAKATQQSKKVKVRGSDVAIRGKTVFKKSTGDQAGAGAGVISGKARTEVTSIKARMNALNVKMQGLSPDQPEQWQGVLQDYAVTVSALYTTLNPD